MTSKAQRFSVGLTGGIGSGKTTVANLLGELGAALVDTDAIAHLLTAPGGLAIPDIAAQFGAEFIDAQGAMDRVRMRSHVFGNHLARHQLEAILHPLIRSETINAAERADGDYLIFVVPLLVESGNWVGRTSRILVVDCDEEVQVARVMARNGLQRHEVEAIMAAQASRAARLAVADDVIENNASAAELRPQVQALHATYLALARQAAIQL
ncbi:dephospho-CoA kinase [Herbaspirillum sp. alder98]|uniref:dephospho-CoA kinase n=1 Tax=Herbaspirillum sp. alder98 TaxID=2913096 RepID=UPI001CD90EAD|nr:dephospho-CoA kinase [Herbaspirillum sp. alder98]MCA1324463.1 dephospho-CoA kinase [Herbaspirillum sp. alder98]